MDFPQLGLPVGSDVRMIVNQDSVEEVMVTAADVDMNVEMASPSSPEWKASITRYEEEWQQVVSQDSLEELRHLAVSGRLRASRFRSVSWRRLMGVLGNAPTNWADETRATRTEYHLLRTGLQVDPGQAAVDDPLSQDQQSPWHQYFCDRELRAVIRQDVIRTFPGVDFFRKEEVQEAMVNVLFCYARENPSMCYRQGMHEILAPLLFVFHCDHQAYLHTREMSPLNETVNELLNPVYLEEDSFALFSKVMSAIQGSYQISNVTPSNTGYFPTNSTPSSPMSENQVLQQLTWIRNQLLAPSDPELHHHLLSLDIPLALFGIRWLRLLFGREFPLQDLLVLWDAIFASGPPSLPLVNYLVVALLIAIRHLLLDSDYTGCLTLLMRYPATMDVSKIIEHALYLKDPEMHDPPERSLPPLPRATVGGRPDLNRGPNTSPSPHSNHSHPHHHHRKEKHVVDRLKRLSVKDHSQIDVPSKNSNIIDGFMLDCSLCGQDPGVVRRELKHCRAVMALVQLKLAQYHSVLERVVPHNNMSAQQALTGIHELCSLLDPHPPSPSPSPPGEVEPGVEVGEGPVSPPPRPLPPPRSEVEMVDLRAPS